jgi:hypothetical protein
VVRQFPNVHYVFLAADRKVEFEKAKEEEQKSSTRQTRAMQAVNTASQSVTVGWSVD